MIPTLLISLTVQIALFGAAAFNTAITLEPEQNANNVLLPEYGVNYRYLGKLNQNLNRLTVVTAVPIPRIEAVPFPELPWNCTFFNDPDFKKKFATRDLIKDTHRKVLEDMCELMNPFMKHIEDKERDHKAALKQIFSDDLQILLPQLSPAYRNKRSLLIPAITGLITLAVEGVSTYIQGRQQRKMEAAVRRLRHDQLASNKLFSSLSEDFLMYGKYNTKSISAILETIKGFRNRTTVLEKMFKGNEGPWKEYFQGSDSIKATTFSLQLSMFHAQMTEEHDANLRLLREAGKSLEKAIGKLIQGYLPIEIFTPTRLRDILDMVAKRIGDDHPGYQLALPQLNHMYDMKLVTFAVDQQTYSMIVSFPLFIRQHQITSMNLYEIETIHVPAIDRNTEADSFTRINMDKEYIATNDNYYITLRTTELLMCKVIKLDYYCEELFMVKHNSRQECASALLFNQTKAVVMQHCHFSFFYNISVPPSVLDGGKRILLANINPDREAKCIGQQGLPEPLPRQNYAIVDRKILCKCRLDLDMTFLLRDLNACPDSHMQPTLYSINMGIFNILEQKNPNITAALFRNYRKQEQIFPISFIPTEEYHWDTDLENYIDEMNNLIARDSYPSPPEPELILENKENNALTIIATGVSAVCLLAIGFLLRRYLKLRTLILATIPLMVPRAHSLPIPGNVVCQDVTFTWVTTIITCIGLAVYMLRYIAKLTWWNGFQHEDNCRIYLFAYGTLKGKNSWVAIKVMNMVGHQGLFQAKGKVSREQVTLSQDSMGDTLTVDWNTYKLTKYGHDNLLPSSFMCPIKEKFRLRRIMATEDLSFDLKLQQDDTYYELTDHTKIPVVFGPQNQIPIVFGPQNQLPVVYGPQNKI